MSDQRQGGDEPSMEEILTSIRQIISEDETSAGTGQGHGASDNGAGAADAAEGDEEDVLELTDEVAPGDDDTAGEEPEADASAAAPSDSDPADTGDDAVGDGGFDDADDVPASPQEALAAAAQAAMEDDEGEAPDLEADRPGEPEMDEAEPGELGDGEPEADDPAPEPEAEEPPEPDDGDSPEPDAAAPLEAMTAADAGESEPEEPEPEPEPEPDEPETVAARMDEPSPAARDAGVESSAGGALASQAIQEQATAALTQLARAAHDRDFESERPKSESDRILENLVREALRPQLKAWLDENLPSLVERIVREEVRRMTVRAQALADEEHNGGDRA